MPAVMVGWPTLSQLRNADYSYFDQLAGYLDHISPKAQNALETLAEDVKRPGGIEWEGEAADAAIAQAGADLVKARPFIWSWDDVSVSARRWQDQLEAGTRTALDAVDDAERNGFEVNDNYSVRDTREAKTQAQYDERRAQAQAHSNFIRHHVGALVGNESRINGELKAMTAEWGTLTFPESGGAGNAEAVGHGFRTGPMLPRDHGNDRPWEYNLDLKSGLLLAGPGHPNAGTVAGIDDVWNELHRCFNCNFPIGGAPHDFPKVGDHIPLSVGMGSNGLNIPFPVEVTQISKTANDINIEFKTLPGHMDGEGATIHFRFHEEGGMLHLGIQGVIAHGPGAIEDFPRNLTAPFEREGYTGVAYTTWRPYIDNLTRHIAEAKGIPLMNVKEMGSGVK